MNIELKMKTGSMLSIQKSEIFGWKTYIVKIHIYT